MNSKLSSPLLFPHGGSAVERTVEVGVEARAWTNLNKALVEGAARQADRSAYGKEAGAYFGRTLVEVCVKRHQVTEVAVRNGYTAMPLQFQTARLPPVTLYLTYGKGIRPRPKPLPLYIDIVYIDFTVRRRFVI